MSEKVYIVSGSVQSGKTTRLFEFVKTHNSIDGILAPIVNGKRKLFHISSREIKDLEVSSPDSSTISVGKYYFLKDSFDWAKIKLQKSYKQEPEWLVIDEIGKLELLGEGLEPTVSGIIKLNTKSRTKIILVIRDYLVDDVLKMYKLNKQNISELKI